MAVLLGALYFNQTPIVDQAQYVAVVTDQTGAICVLQGFARELPPQLGVLAQTMTLAVSLEPAGGSPTDWPTGPVIFTAPLLRV